MRPTNIEDLYPTFNILSVLQRLDNNTLPNALVLAGNSGSGKTTLARLIACRILNLEGRIKEELLEKGIYQDSNYIEIDAAGKGKVDDAKDLSEYIKRISSLDVLTPDEKYVFVLDEAQRYTDAAKESLLSVLENMSKNIYLIFVTSNLESLFNLNKRNKNDGELQASIAVQRRLEVIRFTSMDRETSMKFINSYISKNKIVKITNEAKDYIIDNSFGSPGLIINLINNYLLDPRIIDLEDDVKTSTKDLANIIKKISISSDADLSENMNELFKAIDNIRNNVDSWEKVRIALVGYYVGISKSLVSRNKFTWEQLIMIKDTIEILNKPLFESILGYYDLIQRLMTIITIRKEYINK